MRGVGRQFLFEIFPLAVRGKSRKARRDRLSTAGKLPFPQRKSGLVDDAPAHVKAHMTKAASPHASTAPAATSAATPDVEIVEEEGFVKPESLWAFVGYSDRGAATLSPALASAVAFIRVRGYMPFADCACVFPAPTFAWGRTGYQLLVGSHGTPTNFVPPPPRPPPPKPGHRNTTSSPTTRSSTPLGK